MIKRAVKYCGGCNPRYDRTVLVHQLEGQLGSYLPPVELDEAYDELYVICGCSSRCVDVTPFRAGRIIILDSTQAANEC